MTTAFTSKQPSESFSVSFDFTAVLGTENISSITITATDLSTLEDVTAVILDATKQANTDKIVYAYVQGGTSGHNYLITCLIAGSLGNVFSLDGILPVEESAGLTELPGGPNLATLVNTIQDILQDSAYTNDSIVEKINNAVVSIAAGIRMPDGMISPPLPALYTYQAVSTTTNNYVTMPINYQRKLFQVIDSSGNTISPPRSGDYYSFARFLRQASDKTLAETGSVYRVCLQGRKLFYQGIPSAAETLGLHYYRRPVLMVKDTDEPDGLPEHLQERLIKHYVCKEIFGEALEDGQDNKGVGVKYHTAKFYEAMTDLIDFIGIDGEPQYYGRDDFFDAGACD